MSKPSEPFGSRSEAMETLERWLPRFLDGLSIARGQIALDQVRSQVIAGQIDRLLALTCFDESSPEHPIAACLLLLPDNSSRPQPTTDLRRPPVNASDMPRSDTAVVIHAGSLKTLPPDVASRVAQCLGNRIDRELQDRGIAFAQWATDDATVEGNASSVEWCAPLGFEFLANLQYMTLGISDESASRPLEDQNRLQLRAVTQPEIPPNRQFRDLVGATYHDTLDCPRLNALRSVDQTLNGYRASPAFTPGLWFRVEEAGTESSVGALILAHHRSENNVQESTGVMEIVYMGMVPAARGKRFGAELLAKAIAIARSEHCDRVILAVDRQNCHAKVLYEAAGFEPLLRETVWGRSLPG